VIGAQRRGAPDQAQGASTKPPTYKYFAESAPTFGHTGLLATLTPPFGAQGTLASYGYDSWARLQTRTDPDGYETCWAYDGSSSRLTTETVATPSQYSSTATCSLNAGVTPEASYGLTYDQDGNVASLAHASTRPRQRHRRAPYSQGASAPRRPKSAPRLGHSTRLALGHDAPLWLDLWVPGFERFASLSARVSVRIAHRGSPPEAPAADPLPRQGDFRPFLEI
jgi:YD repeat-containing protein